MRYLKFMTTLKLIIIFIFLILLTAYLCYRISFLAPKRIADEDVKIHLPEGEQYLKVRAGIEASVNKMLNRPFEAIL